MAESASVLNPSTSSFNIPLPTSPTSSRPHLPEGEDIEMQPLPRPTAPRQLYANLDNPIFAYMQSGARGLLSYYGDAQPATLLSRQASAEDSVLYAPQVPSEVFRTQAGRFFFRRVRYIHNGLETIAYTDSNRDPVHKMGWILIPMLGQREGNNFAFWVAIMDTSLPLFWRSCTYIVNSCKGLLPSYSYQSAPLQILYGN